MVPLCFQFFEYNYDVLLYDGRSIYRLSNGIKIYRTFINIGRASYHIQDNNFKKPRIRFRLIKYYLIAKKQNTVLE